MRKFKQEGNCQTTPCFEVGTTFSMVEAQLVWLEVEQYRFQSVTCVIDHQIASANVAHLAVIWFSWSVKTAKIAGIRDVVHLAARRTRANLHRLGDYCARASERERSVYGHDEYNNWWWLMPQCTTGFCISASFSWMHRHPTIEEIFGAEFFLDSGQAIAQCFV